MIAPVGGTLARGFNCAPGAATPLAMMNVYGTRDDYVSQLLAKEVDGEPLGTLPASFELLPGAITLVGVGA